MRLRLVLLLVIGMLLLFIQPASSWPGDAHYTWPVFFGTDNGGPDNGYMTFYDQGASAWTARKLIAADLLNAQWTPQRNAIGWDTNGVWNVSFIEDTSNDLEIWVSQGTQWQDAPGAYLLLDDDATEAWEAVDVETRQDYVWNGLLGPTPDIQNWYIDLSAGVPNWTGSGVIIGAPMNQYSIVLDSNLFGCTHIAYMEIGPGALDYEYLDPSGGAPTGVVQIVLLDAIYPQIIVDAEERLWLFYTASNVLELETEFDMPDNDNWRALPPVYIAAGTLSADHCSTWQKASDIIHIAFIDFNAGGNSTLNYMRRTPNGWSATITLLTVNSVGPGGDGLSWPAITVDPWGAVFIYYIFSDDWTITFAGDLQGYYLDSGFNADFAVPGNWVQHTNIDGEADAVEWCVTQDCIIISGDM